MEKEIKGIIRGLGCLEDLDYDNLDNLEIHSNK